MMISDQRVTAVIARLLPAQKQTTEKCDLTPTSTTDAALLLDTGTRATFLPRVLIKSPEVRRRTQQLLAMISSLPQRRNQRTRCCKHTLYARGISALNPYGGVTAPRPVCMLELR